MNVLALGPHPDDIELGCGATIAKHLRKGDKVHFVIFSDCKESNPGKDLIKEAKKSIKKLGVHTYAIHDIPVRYFHDSRQTILEILVDVKRSFKPDIVYLPSSFDVHQDHTIVYQEGTRCFKNYCTIFGYELPWNILEGNLRHFEEVRKPDVAKKLSCLGCFESQKGRAYFDKDIVRSILRCNGLQVNFEFAEAFDIIRQKSKK